VHLRISSFYSVIPLIDSVPVICPDNMMIFYMLGLDFQFACYDETVIEKMSDNMFDVYYETDDCCDASSAYLILVGHKEKNMMKRNYKTRKSFYKGVNERLTVIELCVSLCAYYDHKFACIPVPYVVTKDKKKGIPEDKLCACTINDPSHGDLGTWAVFGCYYSRPTYRYESPDGMYDPEPVTEGLNFLLDREATPINYNQVNYTPPRRKKFRVKLVQSIVGVIVANFIADDVTFYAPYLEHRMLYVARILEAFFKVNAVFSVFSPIKFYKSYLTANYVVKFNMKKVEDKMEKDDVDEVSIPEGSLHLKLSKTFGQEVAVPVLYFKLFDENSEVDANSARFGNLRSYIVISCLQSYRNSYLLACLAPHFNARDNHLGIGVKIDLKDYSRIDFEARDDPSQYGTSEKPDTTAMELHNGSCAKCFRFGCPNSYLSDRFGKYGAIVAKFHVGYGLFPQAYVFDISRTEYISYSRFTDVESVFSLITSESVRNY